MPELYKYNYFAIYCCGTKLVYVHICFHAARVYRLCADKLPVQIYTGTVAVQDMLSSRSRTAITIAI